MDKGTLDYRICPCCGSKTPRSKMERKQYIEREAKKMVDDLMSRFRDEFQRLLREGK